MWLGIARSPTVRGAEAWTSGDANSPFSLFSALRQEFMKINLLNSMSDPV